MSPLTLTGNERPEHILKGFRAERGFTDRDIYQLEYNSKYRQGYKHPRYVSCQHLIVINLPGRIEEQRARNHHEAWHGPEHQIADYYRHIGLQLRRFEG